MQMIGQRIVDRIDLRISQQLLIRAVELWNAQAPGDRPRPLQVTRSDGRDLAIFAALQRRNYLLNSQFRRTQNSPAKLHHSNVNPFLCTTKTPSHPIGSEV